MTRILDFDDGFESAAEPTQGAVSSTAIGAHASDAAFVTAKGAAAVAGDLYFNTVDNEIRRFDGTNWDFIAGVSRLQQTIANNQVAATNITDLLLTKTTHVSMQCLFAIERQTDSSNVIESGVLRVDYDPVADDFRIDLNSSHDDAGVTFSVTSAGQVQYTSTDITGANYSGKIRISQIVKAVL